LPPTVRNGCQKPTSTAGPAAITTTIAFPQNGSGTLPPAVHCAFASLLRPLGTLSSAPITPGYSKGATSTFCRSPAAPPQFAIVGSLALQPPLLTEPSPPSPCHWQRSSPVPFESLRGLLHKKRSDTLWYHFFFGTPSGTPAGAFGLRATVHNGRLAHLHSQYSLVHCAFASLLRPLGALSSAPITPGPKNMPPACFLYGPFESLRKNIRN